MVESSSDVDSGVRRYVGLVDPADLGEGGPIGDDEVGKSAMWRGLFSRMLVRTCELSADVAYGFANDSNKGYCRDDCHCVRSL